MPDSTKQIRPGLDTGHTSENLPVLCFCHLRWNFVYQRPQHLMTRMNRRTQVHLWEEPLFEDGPETTLRRSTGADGVSVLTPIVPHGLDHAQIASAQRDLLDRYLAQEQIGDFIAWYYTPMALEFTDHLHPILTVYDSMDELSAFDGAPPELLEREQQLFAAADAVFTGGASLFESKRSRHPNVHLFPSSIDHAHFGAARHPQTDPADQAHIPHPRIGFFGVLDERLDRDLVRDTAALHPEWHFILIGPVVKIRAEDLPHAANIHYLGQKSYTDLPTYLANWDVTMLPFARNASTRFISPTKTPEYLAAGKPVVSTPIHDVVHPYADLRLVLIGADATEFAAAIARCLDASSTTQWLDDVDRYLAGSSWDKTFEGMRTEMQRCMQPSTAEADTADALPT